MTLPTNRAPGARGLQLPDGPRRRRRVSEPVGPASRPASTPHFPRRDARQGQGARPRARVRGRLPRLRRPCRAPRAPTWRGHLAAPQRGPARPGPGTRSPGGSQERPAVWLHLSRRSSAPGPKVSPSLVPSQGPPNPGPFPSPFPRAFSAQAPASLTPGPPAPDNFSALPSPNPRTGFLNPARPAAQSRRVTVAFTDQPPLEPRGQRGGAGARWGGGGGVGEGRNGREEEAVRRGGGRVPGGKGARRPRHKCLKSLST